MSKVKTVRLVVCVVCKSKVRKRDAVPYGPSPVCIQCDSEMNDRDVELYEREMEDETLRLRIGW